jgi:hypothetical protein
MFGLAALAAVAAMAFVGASSAMAESTALCEGSDPTGTTCSGATVASHVHFTTPTTEKAHLLSSAINVVCDALYLGDTLALGAPLVIHGNFTYSNCNEEGGTTKCSATQTSTSALIEILKNGSEKAEIKGTAEVLVECSGFIHCVYNGVGLVGAAEGSLGSGHTTITKQTTNKVSGFLCPKTATLDILTESLTALYIRN